MTAIAKPPLVSVIVPVYNAEDAIARCIESILGQSLVDLELILVDDGSADRSGAICDEYAARDSRISVIHKSNEGVAATRMVGIDAARGTYSIQVDADDWVESTMLEELYAKACDEDADMVICDFYYDYQGRKPLKRRVQRPECLHAASVLGELLQYRRISPSLANKLIRHSCYRKYEVQIPSNISHGEDFYVSLSLLRHDELKVSYLPNAYYHYVQDDCSTSLTHTYTVRDFERESRLKDYCLAMMRDHAQYALVEKRMIHNLVRRAFNGGVFTSAEFRRLTYAYRHHIRNNRSIAWHRRYRLYLSCIGYYRWMYAYKAVGNMLKKRG